MQHISVFDPSSPNQRNDKKTRVTWSLARNIHRINCIDKWYKHGLKVWIVQVECGSEQCRQILVVIVIVKANYNYHKKISQDPLRQFFKQLYITLTILYVEDC